MVISSSDLPTREMGRLIRGHSCTSKSIIGLPTIKRQDASKGQLASPHVSPLALSWVLIIVHSFILRVLKATLALATLQWVTYHWEGRAGGRSEQQKWGRLVQTIHTLKSNQFTGTAVHSESTEGLRSLRAPCPQEQRCEG